MTDEWRAWCEDQRDVLRKLLKERQTGQWVDRHVGGSVIGEKDASAEDHIKRSLTETRALIGEGMWLRR
jgi:hypothetical protein